jgi:L-ascorbate metabolism protein UlaG (beta-lactamase superfamily)
MPAFNVAPRLVASPGAGDARPRQGMSDCAMRIVPLSADETKAGQSSAVARLTYIGHATTLLELGGVVALTDPVLGRWVGPLHRQVPLPARSAVEAADVVLISHLHRDHLDRPSLRRLRPGSVLVAPRGAARVLRRLPDAQVKEISPGETLSVGEVTITAVPAVHDPRRDPWGPRAQPLCYVLDSGRCRIYFPGDTDLFAGMAELPPLDVALLPVWGWGPTLGPGHMNPRRAVEALGLLAPGIAIPIHWGSLYPLGLKRIRAKPLSVPPLAFKRLAAELAPEVLVRILEPGRSLSLGAGEED